MRTTISTIVLCMILSWFIYRWKLEQRTFTSYKMAEPKTASAKKVDEPAIFVFANNQTNFESQIELNITILNVNKIGKSEHLTSPQFFIQSLPFHVDIHHETKKPSGKKAIKIDNLNVQLVVGKGIQDQWSSQFSVDFLSTQVLQFQNFVQLELSDTNDTIAHTIEFDAVKKHRNFYFQMHISADQVKQNCTTQSIILYKQFILILHQCS